MAASTEQAPKGDSYRYTGGRVGVRFAKRTVMNWLSNFLPTALIIPFLVYAFVKHEVAEWAYERGKELQASSASFGLLVYATAAVGSLGLYVLLIAYGYDQGWQKAVGLYVAMLLIGFADQIS